MSAAKMQQAEQLVASEFEKGSMEALRDRVEHLRAENELLKKQREKSEKDTHEFVAYFHQELEKKDDLIASLNDQLLKVELQSKRTLEDLKVGHESLVERMRQEQTTEVAKLRSSLKLARDELHQLTEFRELKLAVEQEVRELRSKIKEEEERHHSDLVALERRLLDQKRKQQQEHEREIEVIKKQSKLEAQQGLDADTRKIVMDNLRMVRRARAAAREEGGGEAGSSRWVAPV